MPDDEVELSGQETDDYEVVPVGPIRKLERRLDEVEKKSKAGGADDELVRDVLDIMKSNQKIVNDMTESTHELKNSVEDLTHKMDSVVDNMNEFMDLLKDAAEMDLEGEIVNDMHTQIADAVGDRLQEVVDDMNTSNQEIVSNLEELNESIRRSYASDNKGELLSGRNRGDRSGQRNRQGKQRESSQDQSSGNSERMRKLRKRFENSGNDNQ